MLAQAPSPELNHKQNLPSSKTLLKNEGEKPSIEFDEVRSPAVSTKTKETSSLHIAAANATTDTAAIADKPPNENCPHLVRVHKKEPLIFLRLKPTVYLLLLLMPSLMLPLLLLLLR